MLILISFSLFSGKPNILFSKRGRIQQDANKIREKMKTKSTKTMKMKKTDRMREFAVNILKMSHPNSSQKEA